MKRPCSSDSGEESSNSNSSSTRSTWDPFLDAERMFRGLAVVDFGKDPWEEFDFSLLKQVVLVEEEDMEMAAFVTVARQFFQRFEDEHGVRNLLDFKDYQRKCNASGETCVKDNEQIRITNAGPEATTESGMKSLQGPYSSQTKQIVKELAFMLSRVSMDTLFSKKLWQQIGGPGRLSYSKFLVCAAEALHKTDANRIERAYNRRGSECKREELVDKDLAMIRRCFGERFRGIDREDIKRGVMVDIARLSKLISFPTLASKELYDYMDGFGVIFDEKEKSAKLRSIFVKMVGIVYEEASPEDQHRMKQVSSQTGYESLLIRKKELLRVQRAFGDKFDPYNNCVDVEDSESGGGQREQVVFIFHALRDIRHPAHNTRGHLEAIINDLILGSFLSASVSIAEYKHIFWVRLGDPKCNAKYFCATDDEYVDLVVYFLVMSSI